MSELIGNAQHLHSLEISAGDGLLTKSLRELGGSWSLIGVNNKAASSLSYYLNKLFPHTKIMNSLFQIVTLICLF